MWVARATPNDFVRKIIQSMDISKFEITTLRDVWAAFWEQARDDPKLFSYHKVYFEYGSRRWGGTIKRPEVMVIQLFVSSIACDIKDPLDSRG
jgi:hypothetical protein